MPTNRKRTTRARRSAPIDADEWAVLHDEKPQNPFIPLIRPVSHWRQLWAEYGEKITQKWAEERPGTRPNHWWKFSAPLDTKPKGSDENDLTYLARHGLLLPGEEKASTQQSGS